MDIISFGLFTIGVIGIFALTHCLCELFAAMDNDKGRRYPRN